MGILENDGFGRQGQDPRAWDGGKPGTHFQFRLKSTGTRCSFSYILESGRMAKQTWWCLLTCPLFICIPRVAPVHQFHRVTRSFPRWGRKFPFVSIFSSFPPVSQRKCPPFSPMPTWPSKNIFFVFGNRFQLCLAFDTAVRFSVPNRKSVGVKIYGGKIKKLIDKNWKWGCVVAELWVEWLEGDTIMGDVDRTVHQWILQLLFLRCWVVLFGYWCNESDIRTRNGTYIHRNC